MTRILWDQLGEKKYELGIDRGVFYPKTGSGVPWFGLVSVSKSVSGGIYKPQYIDGVKFMDEVERGNASFKLETFATPKEFLPCLGVKSLFPGLYVTNQPRDSFGFSYRTGLGNDVLGESYGYKIHIISEALTSSTTIKNATLNNTTTPLTYTWDIDVVPKYATPRKPISHVIVETDRYSTAAITALENILYGTVSTAPRLPTQAEINGFMEA
jgi:hypothetical protein